jgi:hypothetical protein
MREIGLTKYIGSKRCLPQWVVSRKGREKSTLFIALPSWVSTMVALLKI